MLSPTQIPLEALPIALRVKMFLVEGTQIGATKKAVLSRNERARLHPFQSWAISDST